MSSDFQHYSFRMPNIGFQNLPLNIYIVVFGTAIFVFILSLLFCCYLIRGSSLNKEAQTSISPATSAGSSGMTKRSKDSQEM